MTKPQKLIWLALLAVGACAAVVMNESRADDAAVLTSGYSLGRNENQGMVYVAGEGVTLVTNGDTVTISTLSDETPDDIAKNHIKWIEKAGVTSKVVALLISSGEVCKVKGEHLWRQDFNCNVVGLVSTPAIYAHDSRGKSISVRTCAVCGLTQTKTESDWH